MYKLEKYQKYIKFGINFKSFSQQKEKQHEIDTSHAIDTFIPLSPHILIRLIHQLIYPRLILIAHEDYWIADKYDDRRGMKLLTHHKATWSIHHIISSLISIIFSRVTNQKRVKRKRIHFHFLDWKQQLILSKTGHCMLDVCLVWSRIWRIEKGEFLAGSQR